MGEGAVTYWLKQLKSFSASKAGGAAIEYALVLGLITTLLLVSMQQIGGSAETMFDRAANAWGDSLDEPAEEGGDAPD